MREVVVLDACVLYSAHLRDFLLHLAHQKLFYPRWSDRIHDEWIRNVLKNRPDLRLENFNRLRVLMNDAFPSANVIPRNSLLKGITLPDPDDVH